MASGNYVGFNPLSVSIVNSKLTGTIQLPEGVTFQTNEPYIVLERASDGTRIGTFVTVGNVTGQSVADYTLTLRGEYNITETDRINVKWSPVGYSEVYLYSGLLSSILSEGAIINLDKQQ